MALLIQLRWTARSSAQIVTIGGVHFWLGIPLQLTRMGAVIGALVFTQCLKPGLGTSSRRDHQQ